MKKLALTSLLAVFAISGANAANVIDGNPLYMPKAGHFYSVTDLGSHSEFTKNWALGEEFGYGVSDKLAITIGGSIAEAAEELGDDEMFDRYGLTDLRVEATYRAFQDGNIVADVYGGVEAGADYRFGGGLAVHSDMADDNFWFDKDLTGYTWWAGARAGYTAAQFTIAGYAEYGYINSEFLNWGAKGMHLLALGVNGQFVIDQNWNLVGGAGYIGVTNDNLAYDDLEGPKVKNAGIWNGYFGVNYNIDANKYVGAYINGSMNHQGGTSADEWEFDDGYGFGFKFGIDF